MPRHRFTVEPRAANAQRVAELRAQGWGIKRIARAIGATDQAVRKALNAQQEKQVAEFAFDDELAFPRSPQGQPARRGRDRRRYPR